MIAPDVKTAVRRLQELVEAASIIVPFTGAGISTECGIPDFRSPGGIWTKMRPIDFSDFIASQEARDESWRRRFAMEESFGGAKPGRGHRALASLYRAGKSPGVVTQNIDNLHQASGIPAEHVVELHGNTTYATCLDCAARYELPWVRQRFEERKAARRPARRAAATSRPRPSRSVRRCPSGDAPRRRTDALRRSLHRHRLLAGGVAGGRLPLMAKRNGAKLVIITREPTDFDDMADLVAHHDIGDVLEPFISSRIEKSSSATGAFHITVHS